MVVAIVPVSAPSNQLEAAKTGFDKLASPLLNSEILWSYQACEAAVNLCGCGLSSAL